jgi:hypothetical protein
LSVAGYWFDDATFTYYPFNAPWARMAAASKQGNPDRLVSFNSWILPKVSDLYEVFAGENDFSAEMINGFEFLPAGGTGKFAGGPQSGLQGQITTIINGDWPFQGKYAYLTPAIFTRNNDCKNTGRYQPQKCSHIRCRSLPGRKNLT